MRILLCSKSPLDPRLGAAQTLLALGGELERLGHAVEYLDPPALGTDRRGLADALKRHLHDRAADYDVVDYDYKYLRFRRDEFPPETLLVARCQLLRAHLVGVKVPPLPRLRSRVGALVRGRAHAERLARAARADDATFAQSDLVVVLNSRDRTLLVERGLDGERIAVIPNGLGPQAAARLDALPAAVPEGPPRVAFVGAFSTRKGAGDFPAFFRRLAAQVPDVRLRLLGTDGMVDSEGAVQEMFPRRLQRRVEVVPRYAQEELAGLLAPCWAGVFPSYNEGFGLGILEMLAAALPVVAYDAPGAADLLLQERLVERGDVRALADRTAALLNDPARLAEARRTARLTAAPYRWPDAAARTAAAYEAALARLRSALEPTAA
jgi:glycosyltransferase involved in cell wall biosynthesis